MSNPLDFVVQELTLQRERIAELEKALENTISALKDYGYREDSIIMISLKNALNK